MSKKDSLIKGTIILTAAAFAARFLGVIQRAPLQAMLGDPGMATYSIAYNIYFILLTVATAGIPSALSKLIAEKNAIGREDEARRIFRAAVWFSLAAGIVITLLLYAGAPLYARRSGDPEAVLAIRALAPALLIFPLIAIIRGFFLGRQAMLANGLSQVVEQIVRVLTAVGLAYALLRLGAGRAWGAAGASFGGVTGAVGALVIMLVYLRKSRRSDQREAAAAQREQRPAAERQDAPSSLKSIYATIFKISIPITLISIMVPLINALDSSMTIPLLKGQLGADQAKITFSWLGNRAQSLAGIPIILAVALSQSAVPVISSAFARKDDSELRRRTSQALRISIFSGLPAVLIIAVGAREINGLLFGNTLGSGVIAGAAIAAMFQIVMMTSGAIMMGLGQMKAPTVHVFIGIAVKLAGNLALAPLFGIYGIVTATALGFIVTMCLNLRSLRRQVAYALFGKRWLGIVLTLAATALAGLAIDAFNRRLVHPAGAFINFFLQSLLIGGLMMVVYLALLIVCRVLTAEDISALPAPARKLLGRWTKKPVS